MDRVINHMVDAKAAAGTAVTAFSASMGWIETVQPIVSLTITVVVGSLTAWYTIERALKLRQERKNRRDK